MDAKDPVSLADANHGFIHAKPCAVDANENALVGKFARSRRELCKSYHLRIVAEV